MYSKVHVYPAESCTTKSVSVSRRYSAPRSVAPYYTGRSWLYSRYDTYRPPQSRYSICTRGVVDCTPNPIIVDVDEPKEGRPRHKAWKYICTLTSSRPVAVAVAVAVIPFPLLHSRLSGDSSYLHPFSRNVSRYI